MNQNLKFRFIDRVASNQLCPHRHCSRVWQAFLALGCCCLLPVFFGSSALGQGDWQVPEGFQVQAESKVTLPAPLQNAGVGQRSSVQPQKPLSQSIATNPTIPTAWPQAAVTFDSQIKPASFETDKSIESHLDSAGAKLSDLKTTVTTKATTWFESLAGMAGKTKNGQGPDLKRMLSSLALVLGGYFGLVWVIRKFNPGGNGQLPKDVVQTLGKTQFGYKQDLQLVRLGSKLVLLLNGPEGTQPIGEITDPAEVEYLSDRCGSKSGVSGFSSSARSTSAKQHAIPNVSGEVSEAGLANVLRTLEKAARKSNSGSIFEA